VEKADATLAASRTRQRRANSGHLPAHLPREEIVIEPQIKSCPCCGGDLHVIGEDRSERLDKIPAKYRVIVTRRPKYACRTCERTGADDTAGIIQAPAPARLIEGGLPTEALVADIVVSKYAWHLPLYRQAQMMAAEGITIDRSTLAHWVGFAAFELMPVYDRLVASLKSSSKLFAGAGAQTSGGPSGKPDRSRSSTSSKPGSKSNSSASPKARCGAKEIRYGLNHWAGLCRFLDDGRIEIDSNTVERSMRPIALSRKNALFAGNDEGAQNWAAIASLIETCKLNGINPHAWLADTLRKLVNRWPASRIDELMPWAYAGADVNV
jgi:transposase